MLLEGTPKCSDCYGLREHVSGGSWDHELCILNPRSSVRSELSTHLSAVVESLGHLPGKVMGERAFGRWLSKTE